MGLDIYLYRYDDYKKTKELENKHDVFYNELWEKAGEYDTMSTEQKDDIRQKVKDYSISLGLNEDGSDKDNYDCIEENHPDFPDHYFKIGYFKSSYNDAGIERILKNLSLPTLSDVFQHNSDDEYGFQPNWEDALIRVTNLIELLKDAKPYRIHDVSGNIFRKSEIKSEEDAMKIFLSESSKNWESNNNYSNINGEFSFHEPMKVLAMIPGTRKIFKEQECIYVVTESDNTWYINALEIVKETCNFVLSKENKEQYYLRWSG